MPRKTKQTEQPASVAPETTQEPTQAALDQRLLTQVVDALRDLARAVREVGLAVVAQEPLRPAPAAGGLSPASAAKAAAVSLPPASPTAQEAPAPQAPPAKPSKAQGEHGGSPKQPMKPAPAPTAATATLQQAQQAVLNFSAKHGAQECAGRLAKLGVTRVSLIEGSDAEKKVKYAQVVNALAE